MAAVCPSAALLVVAPAQHTGHRLRWLGCMHDDAAWEYHASAQNGSQKKGHGARLSGPLRSRLLQHLCRCLWRLLHGIQSVDTGRSTVQCTPDETQLEGSSRVFVQNSKSHYLLLLVTM